MKITFHSWLKNEIGHSSDQFQLPDDVQSISGLASFLSNRYPSSSAVFEEPEALRYVVNRRYVSQDEQLSGVSEIDIYPPVTGG